MSPVRGPAASSHIVGVTPHPTAWKQVRCGQYLRRLESIDWLSATVMEFSQSSVIPSTESQLEGSVSGDAKPLPITVPEEPAVVVN